MFELSAFPLDAVLHFTTKMMVFIGGLAALIFVHELGHFLVARKVGVTVEKFSIGFGPKIFGMKSGETEYLVSVIPLGGYVKMKGEDLEENTSHEPGSFSAARVQDRLAIAFAGPFFNILFAVFVYYFVYLGGVPTLAPVVGTVKPDSPAFVAQLETGDRIVEIDGGEILYWEQLQKIVHASPGKVLNVKIQRNDNLIELQVTPVSEEITDLLGDKEKVGLIGITPLVRNITYVKKGSPAELAGLKVGDRLLAVNETPIFGWGDLKEAAIDKPGQPLEFHLSREGTEMTIPLTPEPKTVQDPEGKETEIGVLGIGMSGELVDESYGPIGALRRSLQETWNLTYLIAVSIKKLVAGSIPADTIGGPILIFQIYGEQAEQGFSEIVRITALLSINLGLLNLLPIPILDGGHIFFFLIEWIRGRPVSEKHQMRAQQVGIFMLISLLAFAFYNDIMRIIS
ncbi:MAG: RIP metalloprotease RseP [Nitrospinae bacterium CG11_big_fil_rev_8_21_14_0_20_56_8]|nr:MAG: RIP metalloprotease RseP [Nitrospinae bacterium CG11_big_fil_rev_8_21_14_0_20_56_8]